MGKIISIMNAKGGVGKSTTTMILAESLATTTKKNRILIIDADPQASISLMMLGEGTVKTRQAENKTLAELIQKLSELHATNINPSQIKFNPSDYIHQKASDVIGAINQIDILIGNIELAWIERQEYFNNNHIGLTFAPDPGGFEFVQELSKIYDFILIDCSPSITTFTEKWLRTSDYNIVPMRPDYLSQTGFELIRRVRQEACKEGVHFANHLGTIITMKRGMEADSEWSKKLKFDDNLQCFSTEIKLATKIQSAAEFSVIPRTFSAKYGEFSRSCKAFTEEVLQRITL